MLSLLRLGQRAGHMINTARRRSGRDYGTTAALTQNAPTQCCEERVEGGRELERDSDCLCANMGDTGEETDAERRPRPFRWNNSNSNRSEQMSRTLGAASALTTSSCRCSSAVIGCC